MNLIVGRVITEPSSHGPLTHGFLFADLRGYTAFAESRGDAAAADLLERYRTLVRAVVADTDGAEIKTEGDSFYVVFPSASRAVAAGLAIGARAAEANAAQTGEPIRVGVGIHAGETEERAEGYVGTAVNIAARVCAQARPGEVLVTETVRSLTRTSGRYRFTARGRPTLKGITEPIAVYAAELADSSGAAASRAPAGRPIRTRAILVAVLGLLAVVLVLGAGTLMLGSTGRTAPARSDGASTRSEPTFASGITAGSTPAPSGPMPLHGGLLQAGEYRSATFQPALDLTIPGNDWSSYVELSNYLELGSPTSETSRLRIFRPQVAYLPCSDTETTILGSHEQDVIDYLLSSRAIVVQAPVATRLGDLEGVMLDVAHGDRCDGRSLQKLFQLWTISGATKEALGDNKDYKVVTGRRSRLYVTEVNGEALVIAVDASPVSFSDFDAAARSLLASLGIAP